jgi:hypothetical protein
MISVVKLKRLEFLCVTSPTENTYTNEMTQTINQTKWITKPTRGKKKMQQFEAVKSTVVLKTAIPS